MTPERVPRASRRELLRAFVNGALAAIGGGVGLVLVRFAYGANAAPAASNGAWFRAAPLGDLDPGKPYAAVLAVPRQDGWSRTRANEVVFLVWDGLFTVRALSATCTHLGCRVRWDEAADRFRCPCHGGAYSAQGHVVAGPPPRPLTELQTRISDEGDVEVRW